MFRLCLLMAGLLLTSGCGYHLPGQVNNLPDDIQTVYVGTFGNRTSEPFVENRVTDSVITEFARSDVLSLIGEKQKADAILTGTVVRYSQSAVAYSGTDRIVEYRSSMSVEAALRRQDTGRTLWKGTLEWSEEFASDRDKSVQEDNEARAIEDISDRISEQLYARILDTF